MATRIQVRRGTTSEWNSANPVLEEGEIGYNSTLGQIKVGDGDSTWSQLYYLENSESLGTSLGSYILDSEKSATNGVAELDGNKDLLVPGTRIIFEGTVDAHETTFLITDPTADRTLTFPDATGTIATTADIAAGVAGGVTETGTQTLTNKTLTSPIISGLTISDGSIVVEGATANDFETTVQFTDPTADRTITFPDATGTVALTSNVAALSGATFTGAVSGTSLTLSGDLTVNGTTTTINSTTLTVDDINITLGQGNTSDAVADGGGITLEGATNKTFNWVDATDAWTSSEHMNLLTGKSYKINGTSITAALPAGLTWGEVKDGKSGLVIS